MAKPKIAKSRIELIVPVYTTAEAPDWDGDGVYPFHDVVPLAFDTVVRSPNTEPAHYCLAFTAKRAGRFDVKLERGADVRTFMSEAQALELWGHLDAMLPEDGKRRVSKTFAGTRG